VNPSKVIGASLRGVFWSPSTGKAYARFFIAVSTGSVLELERNAVTETKLPIEARSMETNFSAVLNGPGISGIYGDGLGEVAVLLLSNQYLHVFGTFDGERTGNNLVLHSPPYQEDWVGLIQREWRRIC